MTPADTPPRTLLKPSGRDMHRKSRTADSSPARHDPNATIKASQAMQRGSSFQEIYQDIFSEPMVSMGHVVPAPPRTVPVKRQSKSFERAPLAPPDFLSMTNMQLEFSAGDLGAYKSSNYSPMSNNLSPTLSSFQSSPEMSHMPLFGEIPGHMQEALMPAQPSGFPASQSLSSLGEIATQQETQARSQSVSELDIDTTVQETGVTCEEIAAFIHDISEPDGKQKYTCRYPNCGKEFGRRENVKSHVQTHLNDRQFCCPKCQKCFVRQHDLKRHVKIHSGVKPYPCPCGADFARHDALTRHRQRNVCVGGIGGAPRSPVKRGRPRKVRPDTDERREKAAKTRQRVLEKTYAASASGSSECSWPSPPSMFDNMDFQDTGVLTNLDSFQTHCHGLPQDIFSATPPTSPGYSTGNCFSSQHSQSSYTPKAASVSPSPNIASITEAPYEFPSLSMSRQASTITDIDDDPLSLSSQARSRETSSSRYGTPPELDPSSSSPAPSNFFDFGPSSEPNSEMCFLDRPAPEDMELEAILKRVIDSEEHSGDKAPLTAHDGFEYSYEPSMSPLEPSFWETN